VLALAVALALLVPVLILVALWIIWRQLTDR
jgi:hypothetical protein